ncbi:MAG: Uma2 family endonuclease [Caldilineaceae bacterium SB0661_bin_32]|uniref:Uma2 family endonuclease n=1 Tax=Caldilineaceae bacterium SB0661_bin_32 TaxID=2605255 RepID=A0A6B1DBZ6_9CHLR|nr:Uma2 family endonuclease [Caldilineaceae bacterium SB0661_bin_32]
MARKEIVHNIRQRPAETAQGNGATLSDGPVDSGAPSQIERVKNRAPAHGHRVTLAEYWEKWYERPHPHIDVSYEWNNGILEAKPLPNFAQTEQYRWFFRLLSCYLEVNPIAKILCLETGAYMSVQDENLPSRKWEVVFKPDIGIILDDNPAPWGADDQRSYIGVCDIIVEELSDSTSAEIKRDTEEKKDGYARAGVKEYFILDPKDRHLHFYRLGVAGSYEEIEPDEEGVIRSQVLPGFQFRREDLLREPMLVELARDDVYANYVIPELQVAETRVEKAEERADAEAQRADVEAAARRAAEEETQALKAELARLRQQRS